MPTASLKCSSVSASAAQTVRKQHLATPSISVAPYFLEPIQASGKEFVFIDSAVPEREKLRKGVLPGREVCLLSPEEDAIAQITSVLQSQTNVRAVHIVSHGSPGCLHFGQHKVDAAAIDRYSAQLESWFAASSSVDIACAARPALLLYGCNVAVGDTGTALLAQLQRWTGASVAASDTPTGDIESGGDWTLGKRLGPVEVGIAFSLEAMGTYRHLLADPSHSINLSSPTTVELAQLGQDIDGEAALDQSGSSVSLSADGSVVAIGARFNDGNGNGNSGHVRLYERDNTGQWVQLGQDIDGEAAVDQSGSSVSLSADGSVVAIGAIGNDDNGSNSGHVRLYKVSRSTTTTEDTVLSLPGITVSDADGDLDTTQLSVTNGTLFVDLSGGAALSGDNNDATLTLSGTEAQINAALSTLTYQGNPDFHGTDTLTLTSTDTAGTTTTDTLDITVTPINDAPILASNTSALSLDGTNDYATTSTSISHDETFTYEAWVKFPVDNPEWSGIVTTEAFSGSDNNNFVQLSNTGSGMLRAELADSSTTHKVDGSTTISDNQWHHVAVTYNGSTIRLYVDGNLDTSRTASATLNVNRKIRIGAERFSRGATTRTSQGTIDEVRIWDVARTQADIQASLNQSVDPNSPDLLAYWTFDEGVGNSTADLTGNGHTASFVDSATWTTETSPLGISELASVEEDAAAPSGAVGTLISDIVDLNSPVAGNNNVTDADATVTGIAITAVDTTNGSWFYTIDSGTTWTPLSAVGDASALLLAADTDTRVYFQPSTDFNGTLTDVITFRAWDQTTGANGSTADTSTNGGSTAFSTDTSTASIEVTAVNDAPVNTIPSALTTNEDTELSISGLSITDVDGNLATTQLTVTNGTLSVNLAGGATISAGTNSSASPTLSGDETQINAALATLTYQGNSNFHGTDTLTVISTDAASTSTTNTLNITIANVNDAPIGSIVITGTVQENSELSVNISALADADGLPTTYSYQWQIEDNGSWTNIADATDSTFTPGDAQAGQEVRVQLSYTDQQGTTESVISDTVTVANVNDAPTGSITITGTAQENSELSVDASVLADNDGLPNSNTYSYQWQVEDNGSWTNIAAATESTFTPGDAQAGKEIRVQLSYIDQQGTTESVTSDTVTVANVNDTPTGSITITGTAQEDSELSVDISALADADGLPTTYSYQWQIEDNGSWTNIDSATESTFTPGDAQASQEIRVQLSYTDQQGTTESVTSDTVTVANVNDAPTGSIVITGTKQEDSELSVDISALADTDGLPTTYSYQWQVEDNGSWTNIAGATDSTFTPGDAQADQEIRVQLSYTDQQSSSEVVDSAAVTIANVNDAPIGSITITGTTQEDSELSVDTSALSDNDGLPDSSAYSYQWQVKDDNNNWNNIAAETERTFTPSNAQAGKEVRVLLDYTDRQGTPESVVSTAVTIANTNNLPMGAITIDRRPESDSTLFVDTSTLVDDDGLPNSSAYTYLWQVKEGDSWINISGATNSTFTPAKAQAGKSIRAQVRYTDLQGTNESIISSIAVVPISAVQVDPDSTELEIVSFGPEDNTLELALENSNFLEISNLRILRTSDIDGTLEEITSLTLVENNKLPNFRPVVTIDSDLLSEGDSLQIEIIQDNITYTARPVLSPSGDILFRFDNGTTFNLAFTDDTEAVDLLLGDADAIDLTSTGNKTQLAFTVYREADYDNLVGFFTMDEADGSLTDDMGVVLRPGDVGYKEAALARQLDIELTGENGRARTFTADLPSGDFLGSFLIADGTDLETDKVYFSHMANNDNNSDHVKMLGANTIGFEDQIGLGDRDFNDIVVNIQAV